MGHHDEYGKRVLRLALGKAFTEAAPVLTFPGGGRACIDGAIQGRIAVEVEARNSKQIRGAIVDLVCHPLKKKLLVLMAANTNTTIVVPQAKYLFERFAEPGCQWEIAVLVGRGGEEAIGQDINIVTRAVRKLGVEISQAEVGAISPLDYLPPHLRNFAAASISPPKSSS